MDAPPLYRTTERQLAAHHPRTGGLIVSAPEKGRGASLYSASLQNLYGGLPEHPASRLGKGN